MEVNDAMVDKLAHLSRLEFNDTEKKEIKNDLQRMIAFVEKLNELNLDGVQPMLFMSEEVNVLREDEVKGSVRREDALKKYGTRNYSFRKYSEKLLYGQAGIAGTKRHIAGYF